MWGICSNQVSVILLYWHKYIFLENPQKIWKSENMIWEGFDLQSISISQQPFSLCIVCIPF